MTTPMTAWTSDEPARIGAAEELQIAPARRDGTLHDPLRVWVVRHGDARPTLAGSSGSST